MENKQDSQENKCVKVLPRPSKMKGLHNIQTRNNILIAIGLSFFTVSAYYWKNTFRKDEYAKFYA